MEFQYKGLKATLEHIAVTEEEIERQLKRLEGQDTSEYTPEELRQGVADSLRAYYDEQAEQDLLDNLGRQAAATLDYTPSESELDASAQMQLETLKGQLAKRDLTLEAYCEFMNTDMDTIMEDLRADAAGLLKVQKALLEVARLEGLVAEKEEIDQLCKEICQANQLSSEEFAKLYDENMAQMLVDTILLNKALMVIRQNAEIEEIFS